MEEESGTYNQFQLDAEVDAHRAETEQARISAEETIQRLKIDQLTGISMAVLLAVTFISCITIIRMTGLQSKCIDKGWTWHGWYCEAPKLENHGTPPSTRQGGSRDK